MNSFNQAVAGFRKVGHRLLLQILTHKGQKPYIALKRPLLTPQSVRPTVFGLNVDNTGSICASALTRGGGAHRGQLFATAGVAAVTAMGMSSPKQIFLLVAYILPSTRGWLIE